MLRSEKIAAALIRVEHGLRDMLFDHALADAETESDRAVGQTFERAEEEDLAAAWGSLSMDAATRRSCSRAMICASTRAWLSAIWVRSRSVMD